LADEEVAALLEAMLGLAAKKGHLRTRTGPKDPALRHARVCYNHLAGDLGVRMMDSLLARKLLTPEPDGLTLTAAGRACLADFSIDIAAIQARRRPLCKACLDWSNRRSHLAGPLAAALLNRFYTLGWARRLENSRTVAFTPSGEAAFLKTFPLPT